jgi:hypothetical protein
MLSKNEKIFVVTSIREQKITYLFYIACARGTMPSKADGSDRQVLTISNHSRMLL